MTLYIKVNRVNNPKRLDAELIFQLFCKVLVQNPKAFHLAILVQSGWMWIVQKQYVYTGLWVFGLRLSVWDPNLYGNCQTQPSFWSVSSQQAVFLLILFYFFLYTMTRAHTKKKKEIAVNSCIISSLIYTELQSLTGSTPLYEAREINTHSHTNMM